jgi:hypothetical protein
MANFVLTKNNKYNAGVNPVPGTDTITVYDSGSIVTIPQPGGSAVKLTDGTQQSATTAACDSTVPGLGNCVNGSGTDGTNKVSTYGPAGNALGFSILGE